MMGVVHFQTAAVQFEKEVGQFQTVGQKLRRTQGMKGSGPSTRTSGTT